jgi:hypothetical protein
VSFPAGQRRGGPRPDLVSPSQGLAAFPSSGTRPHGRSIGSRPGSGLDGHRLPHVNLGAASALRKLVFSYGPYLPPGQPPVEGLRIAELGQPVNARRARGSCSPLCASQCLAAALCHSGAKRPRKADVRTSGGIPWATHRQESVIGAATGVDQTEDRAARQAPCVSSTWPRTK